MVSMIWEFLIRNCSLIVSGAIGTLGFCLFFRIRRDKLIYGCIGGLLTSLFYCPYCKGSCDSISDTSGNSPDAWRDFILYNERYCRWRYGKGTGTGWNHASGGTGHCRGNCVYFRYFLSVDQLEQTAKGYEEQALATGVRKAW